MLELFLAALEDQLGLLVNPPLAPIARMNIISLEITRLTRADELLRAPVQSEQNGAVEIDHTGIPATCPHPDCVRLFQTPRSNRSDGG